MEQGGGEQDGAEVRSAEEGLGGDGGEQSQGRKQVRSRGGGAAFHFTSFLFVRRAASFIPSFSSSLPAFPFYR